MSKLIPISKTLNKSWFALLSQASQHMLGEGLRFQPNLSVKIFWHNLSSGQHGALGQEDLVLDLFGHDSGRCLAHYVSRCEADAVSNARFSERAHTSKG